MIKKILIKIISNKFIRKLFNLKYNPYYDITFNDICKNFIQAVEKINNSKNFKNYKSTIKKLNSDVKKNNLLLLDLNADKIIVPLICSIINSKEIKILDYGGGQSPIGLNLKEFTKNKFYTDVIEKNAYVKAMNKIFKSRKIKNIKYFEKISQVKQKNYDIVYFGSVIQYLEDKEEMIIKQCLIFKPRYLVFTKVICTKNENNFYSLQVYEKSYLIPFKFFSKLKLINFLKKHNYKILFDQEHSSNYIHEKLNKDSFTLRSFVFGKL